MLTFFNISQKNGKFLQICGAFAVFTLYVLTNAQSLRLEKQAEGLHKAQKSFFNFIVITGT